MHLGWCLGPGHVCWVSPLWSMLFLLPGGCLELQVLSEVGEVPCESIGSSDNQEAAVMSGTWAPSSWMLFQEAWKNPSSSFPYSSIHLSPIFGMICDGSIKGFRGPQGLWCWHHFQSLRKTLPRSVC